MKVLIAAFALFAPFASHATALPTPQGADLTHDQDLAHGLYKQFNDRVAGLYIESISPLEQEVWISVYRAFLAWKICDFCEMHRQFAIADKAMNGVVKDYIAQGMLEPHRK